MHVATVMDPMGTGVCTHMNPGGSGIIWHETKTSLQNSQEFIELYAGSYWLLERHRSRGPHVAEEKNKDCST